MCYGGKRGRGQTAEVRETFREETPPKQPKNGFLRSLCKAYAKPMVVL